MNVVRTDDGLSLQAFGSCHPTACDWGIVKAHLYTRTVSDNPLTDAVVITGNYDHGFAHTEIVLELAGENSVRYEVFTHFSDRSRRSDYFDTGDFSR